MNFVNEKITFTHLQIYPFTNLLIYKFAHLQIYPFTNLPIYKFAHLQIYSFTNLQIAPYETERKREIRI